MWEKLSAAIIARNSQLAKDLLSTMESSELEKKNNSGETLLILAIKTNQRELGEILIDRMDDHTINAVDNQGRTAFLYAERYGMNRICKLLIPKISIDTVDAMGRTALILALCFGMEETSEQLISIMSTEAINAVDHSGGTALTWAATKGMKKICELLIPIANVNAVDDRGCTALYWAISNNHEEVSKLLVPEMSINAINAVDISNKTVLMKATSWGMEEVCKLLILKMNANSINAISNEGSTALSCTIEDKPRDPYKWQLHLKHYESAIDPNEPMRKDMSVISKILIPLMSVEAIRASKAYGLDYSSKTLLEYTKQHNQISLYKMLFVKAHSSCESAFGKVGETEPSIIESIKKSLFSLADFFIKSFTNSDSNEQAEIKFEDFSKFKSYQQINRDLFKSCIDHLGEDGARLLKKVDTYIAVKYFTIAGISPSISLPEDPANHIFSFLEFPSLLAINTFEANAVAAIGEYNLDASSNS